MIDLNTIKPASLAKPKGKPRVSANELKEYWESKNYVWEEAKPKKAELRTKCPCCHGTGEYTNAKFKRKCFRCKGKGYMDMDDHRRFEVRQASIKNGTQNKFFRDYESANGLNDWRAAA